jgi:trans-aconitate methyltransferase
MPHELTVWSPDAYAANARFVADLGAPVLDLLAPRRGERILDLGCGDGALTQALGAAGATVVGIDDSAYMAAAARRRGLDARVMDGQAMTFNAEFDAVFSNAALHWMPDAGAVLAGVARALRPGGRFVAEMGGHGNVASIATALRAAKRAHGVERHFEWFFPTADEYATLLQTHGFAVQWIALIPRPTVLPTGMAGWLTTFSAPFLGTLPAEKAADILRDVESLLAPSLRTASGMWIADYVRLRFAATRIV